MIGKRSEMLSDVEWTSWAEELDARVTKPSQLGIRAAASHGVDAWAVAEKGKRDCVHVCRKTMQVQLKK